MQTILGANGIIATELAKELRRNYTSDLRLVSRNPKKVIVEDKMFFAALKDPEKAGEEQKQSQADDNPQRINHDYQLVVADLLDPKKTAEAVKGSRIVYFTAGLPMDTRQWEEEWVEMVKNAINACILHKAKLVYFDNTYMYGKTDEPITENTAFASTGRKGIVRAQAASLILEEISKGTIEAVICRAPEFYGPGKTQSITNVTIFENIREAKKLKVFLRDDTLRTLIYTPDAARAMALIGNTPDAYGQTWHLPCDDNRLTYKQLVALSSALAGKPLKYTILKKWVLTLAGMLNKQIGESLELLPRYEVNNLFDSSKFKTRFPDFRVTTYREGIQHILAQFRK